MMKSSHILGLATAGLIAGASGTSAAVVDVIDATDGQPGTFFVPGGADPTDDPYYRDQSEDWGWMHNPIAGGFASAKLNISAWDVDEAPCGLPGECEEDLIQGFDAATSTWKDIGLLSGEDDEWSFTEFDLLTAAGGDLSDDITTGLKLRIDIDSTNTGNWLVSLAKSVITTDGATPPPPEPGAPIPLPAGLPLLMTGLGALGGVGALRRRKAS